ncbi:MAG: N-acetyltransferase [Wenzhouxiangellaceae bacterium]|nr:N-acetyltransferase [Wenzhouxiangellaceae bacterium]
MSSSDTRAVKMFAVKTRRQWNHFHQLPARLNSGDSAWVPPLALQLRQMWAPRHPFFRHARAQAWVAMRDGQPVGRISAQVDELRESGEQRQIGHFGQLEAIDEAGVFKALFGCAGQWLGERGKTRLQGPFDLSINQQCGVLVDGYEHAPMMMMNYNPPYYSTRIEEQGFAGVAELLAYRGDPDVPSPPAVERLLARMGGRLEIVPVTRSDLAGKAGLMRSIFNEAWHGNWGFVPLTEAEFAHMAAEMKLLVRPGYVRIAYLDGEPVGFIVALPDLNGMIADLGGRLWPTGAIRLLSRIARKKFNRVRIPLMGVVEKHQHSIRGAAISYGLIDSVRKCIVADGVKLTEQSWILEQNRGVRSIIESLQFKVAQRFRIYERELAA